ncbi:MAG: NADH-quinone oxidoreductase subunit N [Verrucomicrobiia bacterium]
MLEQLTIIGNELLLVALGIAVVSISLIKGKETEGEPETLLAAGGLTMLFIAVIAGVWGDGGAFGGTYYSGAVERVFKSIFLLSGALTALISYNPKSTVPQIPKNRIGEHLGLLIMSILGMCFIVSAKELVLLYIGMELTTMPIILLVAFNKNQLRSAEAATKYVLFAALSSGLLLYGLSYVYGATGTTVISDATAKLEFSFTTFIALIFILAGVGFKMSAAPFHLWTPDTYEGAPTPVTAFLSVASKAAGFALFYKFIVSLFPYGEQISVIIISLLAVLTMTIGNLIALYQKNLKRFLAFSSIAQAGYIMLGLVNPDQLGLTAVLFYLIVYLVSNMAAFGVVTIVAAQTGKEEMQQYVGFSQTNPFLASVMMLAMFSLAGIPPLAGFLGKFILFASAAKIGLYWLVLIATVNATISLYYYLIIIKWMYLVKAEDIPAEIGKIKLPLSGTIALGATSVGMILVGVLPQVIHWIEISTRQGF